MQKFAILHAEIVKFGLIITHLKSFGWKTGGKKIFLGENVPHGITTALNRLIIKQAEYMQHIFQFMGLIDCKW